MSYQKPKPIIIDHRLDIIKNSIKRCLNLDIYRNCLNCKEWDEGKEECKRFKARPPAAIIVYSCPQWEENPDFDIPF